MGKTFSIGDSSRFDFYMDGANAWSIRKIHYIANSRNRCPPFQLKNVEPTQRPIRIRELKDKLGRFIFPCWGNHDHTSIVWEIEVRLIV